MRAIKSICVPQPCHQSWELMNIVEGGRHCESCCKTVVDFTGMSNEEVENYLSISHSVCGRFENKQLFDLNSRLGNQNRNISWKQWFVAAYLMGTTLIIRANEKLGGNTIEMTQFPGSQPYAQVEQGSDSLKYRTIKGQVVVSEGGLPGVQIRVDGTQLQVITDIEGKFTCKVPATTQKLTALFVGYQATNIYISEDKELYVAKMEELPRELSVVTIGYAIRRKKPFVKRVYFKYIKLPVSKIFDPK